MKYIETFESNNAKTDIEDLMLYFEDNGDIRNLKITVMENQTTFRLEFQINEQIIGFDKIALLDEIVKRLNRKYKQIYVESSYLYIDTIHKNYKYIQKPIIETINDECKMLDNFKKYTSDKYPGWEFLGTDEKNIYLDYDTKSKRIHIKDGVWNKLKYRYLLNHKDISEIFKQIIQQKYGFEISEAIYEESGRVI